MASAGKPKSEANSAIDSESCDERDMVKTLQVLTGMSTTRNVGRDSARAIYCAELHDTGIVSASTSPSRDYFTGSQQPMRSTAPRWKPVLPISYNHSTTVALKLQEASGSRSQEVGQFPVTALTRTFAASMFEARRV